MKKLGVVALLVSMCLLAGCGMSREKILERELEGSGYGEGVDWSKQSFDDASIAKTMDVTRSREEIEKTFLALYGECAEYDGTYGKPWWEYIPDSYDLSKDVYPATPNYVGEEKQYNDSIMQSVISDGFTSGQLYDMGTVRSIAESFIYEDVKDKFKWTADLDQACKAANTFDVADFYAKKSTRPVQTPSEDGDIIAPPCLTAYYNTRTVGYSKIGIPKFGGYEFNISVWEDKGELVGWKNDYSDGSFMYPDEIYENMGEWDFYDELEAIETPTKVVKPDVPNGVKMANGETTNLATEQYVLKKIGGGCGMIYYYGNGITVDMTYYGKDRGGKLEEALAICRAICGNA